MPVRGFPNVGATPAQRRALESPIRLEILGHFTDPSPLSVGEIAERMGRSPHSIYYQVHRMVEAGLLRATGQRSTGGRNETVYEPVQRTLRLDRSSTLEDRNGIERTMAAAFRMAERDLSAALDHDIKRHDRPVLGTRLHFRADPRLLAKVRGHLEAALELIQTSASKRGSSTSSAAPLYSLTLALLPLHGRSDPEDA